MNVVRVNGINNVNSNQGYKKNSCNPNFGYLAVTGYVAKAGLIEKTRECRPTFLEWLRKLILFNEDSILSADTTVKTNGENKIWSNYNGGKTIDAAPENLLEEIGKELESITGKVDDYVPHSDETLEEIINRLPILW